VPDQEIDMKPLVALCLLAIGLQAGAPPAHAQGRGETVRIQDFPGPGNLLMRVARSKGYCEQAGIRCQMQAIATPTLGLQALVGGSIDVAVVGAPLLVQAVARGAKVQAVAGISPNNVALVALRRELATPRRPWAESLAALKGRRVAIPTRGSGGEVMMNRLLEEAGLRPADVTYVGVGSPHAAHAALANGQVDAFLSWEPAGLLCEQSRRCEVVWSGSRDDRPADLAATKGFGVLMLMRQDALQERPHVAQALVRAAREAQQFMAEPANLDELVRLYHEHDSALPAPAQGDALVRPLLQRMLAQGNYRIGLDRRAADATVRFVVAGGEALPQVPDAQQLIWPQAPQP
jgi:NitT/TauT family transport system substrate-binding protein